MTGVAPLDGLRIVDLSSGIPGAYATKMLADGGAEVIKVESPEGDPLRHWAAATDPAELADDGALFQFLTSSKRSLVAEPGDESAVAWVKGLIAAADAVVWSRGSRLAELAPLSPSALCELAPHAPVLAITPFGLDGPWADRAATEPTLQAWVGSPGQRGSKERPPVIVGGRTGEWLAGLLGAMGVLASRERILRTGVGELLDVSILETLILMHTGYALTHYSASGSPQRPERSTNLPGIHAARDGYVGFMVVTGQQWLDYCSMIDQPDWAEDQTLLRFDVRNSRRADLLPTIDAWVAQRTVAEIVELASLFRIPVAQVGNGELIPTFDHFIEGGFVVKNPRSEFLQPNLPYKLSGGAAARPFSPAPRLGEHTAEYRQIRQGQPQGPPEHTTDPHTPPFEGLRIADFTAFWAGPVVGHFFAMHGADVIHIESAKRPDGMRFGTIKTMQDPDWWEWAPGFHGPNTDKRDLTLDLQSDRGRQLALRLVEHCDVVIENYSPRVMEGWGLAYDDLRKVRPDLIMVRMPAFGLAGPWRDRVGYAQTMEQVSGLAWITGHPDQAPEVPNGPCDPIAGGHAAFALMLALEHRRRTGKGMLVEVPMVGSALNVAAEQVIEASAYGNLLERQGNRDLRAAPQNIFLSADVDDLGTQDRWVLVSVDTDAQWEALRTALGNPAWTGDPSHATVAGRRAAHDQIDKELSDWCRSRSSDEIVRTLWSAGVPVGKVMLPHEQGQLPQLEEREFFQLIEHPVTGANLHARHPIRFSASSVDRQRRPAPLLGQHNREVLGDLMGLSASEITDLEKEGVIGSGFGEGKGSAW